MIDYSAFRTVLGHYPTGVCVVTSIGPIDEPLGMSIGSFISVSLHPPLVAFLPCRRSTTWQRVRGAGRLRVNFLGAHQEEVSRRFAIPADNKFGSLSHRSSDLGLPILDGVVAWIDCQLHAIHQAGDHDIAVGAVAALATEQAVQPLVCHRGGYGQLSPLAAAA